MTARAPHAAEDRRDGRHARRAAVVIAGTMIMWMAAQAAGAGLGWPDAYAFLFDLAALAGLCAGLAMTWQLWRRRRVSRPGRET